MLSRMRWGRPACLLWMAWALVGCPNQDGPRAEASSRPSSTSSSSKLEGGQKEAHFKKCGGVDCRLFASPQKAFSFVLSQQPRVLAVGEAHALKAAPDVPSATERFRANLLPLLKGAASDFLVELLVPRKDCKKTTARVKKAQRVVTKRQRKSNQNEFLRLAHAAKKLGMVSHPLRPTCEAYAKVVRSGPDAVPRLLTTIAELSEQKLKQLVERNRQKQDTRMVVALSLIHI